MENRQRYQVITIKDLWALFLGRIGLIMLIPVICVVTAYGYHKILVTPEYESTATLYILKQENEANYNYTNQDFSLALDVVNDCTYILKSHAVLDEVIDTLNLEMGYKELYRAIETNNPSDTRVLEVIVTTTSPELSKKIADEVCLIGTDKITDAMGFKQVNLYEQGLETDRPSNSMGIMAYALIATIAGIITFSIIVLAFVLDDRFKNEEDIERYLGLSILGDIPNADEHKRNHYGQYKEYAYGRKKK